jgi:hypothetical protein
LKEVIIIGIKGLEVLGNSKLVIDWENRKNTIQNLRLSRLLEIIRSNIEAFEWIYFSCIYRELNTEVGGLSKQTLSL